MLRLLFFTFLNTLLFAELHEAKVYDMDFDAAQRYCSALKGEWRTLSIKELFELRGNRSFSQTESFWSSDTAYDGISRTGTGSEGDGGLQQGSKIGYTFFLRDGDVTLSPVTKKTGVICTDEAPQRAEAVYTSTAEGIVDASNSILWNHLDAFDKKQKRSFEAAREFCENMDLHNRSWRLPTVDELYAIVTYDRVQPSVQTDIFGIMMSRYYWSDDELNAKDAYVVGFKLGSVATSAKENQSYFRCVSDLDE